MTAAEYFELTAYQPTMEIGTRVSGKRGKVPFRGSVFNDTLVSLDEGPYVTVHLDLPIQENDALITIIKCKHADVKVVK